MSYLQKKPIQYEMPDGKIYNLMEIKGRPCLVHFPYYGAMEIYKRGHFTRKQKKQFGVLNCGFELAQSRKERLTFLTLSTQYDVVKDKQGRAVRDHLGNSIPLYPRKMQEKRKGLNAAFTKLKQMIERKIQSIFYERYCKRHEFTPYDYVGRFKKKKVKYKLKYDSFRYKLRYFKLKTAEGGGVLHIVFRKAYNVPSIPFEWLRMAWYHLWGAKYGVNIKAIDVTNAQGLTMYMVGQYFQKQPVLRMSYGYFWAVMNRKARFNALIEKYGYETAKKRWIKQFRNNMRDTGSVGYQKKLRWRKLKTKIHGVVLLKKPKYAQTMPLPMWFRLAEDRAYTEYLNKALSDSSIQALKGENYERKTNYLQTSLLGV